MDGIGDGDGGRRKWGRGGEGEGIYISAFAEVVVGRIKSALGNLFVVLKVVYASWKPADQEAVGGFGFGLACQYQRHLGTIKALSTLQPQETAHRKKSKHRLAAKWLHCKAKRGISLF